MLATVPDPESQSRHAAPRGVLVFGIAAAAFMLYSGTFNNAFVWDDVRFVQENEAIRDIGVIPRLIGALFSQEYFEISREFYYRPVVTISYALDYAVWGPEPFGFHVTNAVLHAVASGLLVLAAARLFGATTGLLAGAVFAVHPIHTEAVALITGRVDLWPTVFVLGSVLSWLKSHEGVRPWAWVCVAAGLYALGCLSKEIAFTCPLLLLLADAFTMRQKDYRTAWSARLPKHLPVWGVAAAYLVVRFGVLEPPMTAPQRYGDGLAGSLVNTAPIVVRYVGLFIWPRDLSIYHNWPQVTSAADPQLVRASIVLGTFTFASWLLWKPRPGVLAGWVAFLICLGPVLNIVPIKIPIAERYVYLASAGLSIMAASIWVQYGSKVPQPIRRVAGVALLLALAVRTAQRNEDYASEAPLYAAAVTVGTENGDAYYNYGLMYYRVGDLVNAERMFRQALSVKQPVAQALGPLANVLVARGETTEALTMVDEAIRLQPEEWQLHFIRGQVFAQSRQWSTAVASYETALSLVPASLQVRLALGHALHAENAHTKVAALCELPIAASEPAPLVLEWNRLCESASAR